MNRALRRQQGRILAKAGAGQPAATAFAAAVAARSAEDLDGAEALYHACLRADPRHVSARNDLGLLLLRRGQRDAAMAQFRHVLQIEPTHALALLNLSLAQADVGDHAGARAMAERAVAAAPQTGACHAALAHALLKGGDDAAAIAAFGEALRLEPGAWPVRRRLTDLLRRAGRLGEALAQADALVAQCPDDIDGYAERAAVHAAAGRLSAARHDLHAATQRPGSGFAALRRLCEFLTRHEGPEAALAELDLRLDAQPSVAGLWVERAAVSRHCRDLPRALHDLQKAAALDPADPAIPFEIGEVLFAGSNHKAATAAFLVAQALKPDWAEVYYNLASIRLIDNDTEGALTLVRHAASLAPGSVQIATLLCWLRMRVCDWPGLEQAFRDTMARSVEEGLPFSPFALLALGLPPAELHLWIRAWAETVAPPGLPALTRYDDPMTAPAGRPIRVGYLSADFKAHATATLVAELFGLADRSRIEAIGYNIGTLDATSMAGRMARALDGFVDLTLMGDEAAARRIAADRLDILVDLKGYTAESRPGILAFRPAPIQVNFLGFPGSMGTTLIDYVIADAIVAPADHQGVFDEAIVHLPHCYQPNDRSRPGPDPHARRADHGLPETGIVFCCFNSIYKVTPLLFDCWMRLLAAVPGAVLWLMDPMAETHANLRREAQARGIDPARLVFAPRVPFELHMARLGLADMFLDTLPVNAHTTASEALWAGLPVVTCLGPTFAGRVAASLLQAAGLPELVCDDLPAYEAQALALARDPARLAGLRARLAADRLTCPLFDTPRYAAAYEAALRHMVALRAEGRAPAPFAVEADNAVHHAEGPGAAPRPKSPARPFRLTPPQGGLDLAAAIDALIDPRTMR